MAKYVGKRIVPRLCGAWNDHTKYEMLSVVLDENTGDSYVARKEVPAGTGLNQTEYWALSSRYSQQIQNFSNQLTETLRQVKADNDETEAIIRQSNAATAQAIANDNDETESTIRQNNAATRDHVDEALGVMNQAKQSFDSASAALTTRMDSIVGGATTDTEVLDARVDAEETTHANLGAALRYVHSELIGQKNVAAVPYINGHFIAVNGSVNSNEDYGVTDLILCDKDSRFLLQDVHAGPSSLAYAFYAEDKTFISGQNNVDGDLLVTEVPDNAKYIRCSSMMSAQDHPLMYVNNARALQERLLDAQEKLSNFEHQTDNNFSNLVIEPRHATFFRGMNYFDPERAVLMTDRFVDTTGQIRSSASSHSLIIPVWPGTRYFLYIPNANRSLVDENETDVFQKGEFYTCIHSRNTDYPIEFTTGETAKFIMVYFSGEEYDYEALKDQISLQIDEFVENPRPYIPEQYFPGQGFLPRETIPMQYIPTGDIAKALDPLTGTQVLIFGDSITTTCKVIVDENKCTREYAFYDPSNSYTDEHGNLVRFSMWPKILRDSEDCEEIRNYAYSGASFKTAERTAGNERQNLHYQIDLAINDVDNPNGAFSVDHFSPDIVIFALGTNDGVPNDDYESAMAVTVLKEDGHTVDVDETIDQLSETKFCQSARKAFMRIKRAFPMAQLYCVLPLQKAFDEINTQDLHDKLMKMAGRYGCVIIDGTFSSGITRDGNEWNGLGNYLKDGLHPNEKGQNLMARMIITSLKQHYSPFGEGFNN